MLYEVITLYVELILGEAAFREFCETNHVEPMDAASAARLDADRQTWREGVKTENH